MALFARLRLGACSAVAAPFRGEFGAASVQCRNFGSGDMQAVAIRIKSVKSIQKITKAMKMVAASKLKADQRRLEAGAPFSAPAQDVMNLLPISTTEPAGKNTAIVVLASDKGLCGGINSAVAKMTKGMLAGGESGGAAFSVYCVGEKVRSALEGLYGKYFASVFTEVSRTPFNYAKAALISEAVRRGGHDRIRIVYNHFKSAISYETRALEVLSLAQFRAMHKRELNVYESEPEMAEFFPDFYEFYLTCCVYGCMLDSLAAEQSARMSAMDNASTNASDMLQSLTLKFNRARQSKITLELIEIIGGANALGRSTVRLLVACARAGATELLGLAAAGVGDEEGPVVADELVEDLLLGGLVDVLLVVGHDGLGDGLPDGVDLGSETSAAHADPDVDAGDALGADDVEGLKDLGPERLGADVVERAAVDADHARSPGAERDGHGALLPAEGLDTLSLALGDFFCHLKRIRETVANGNVGTGVRTLAVENANNRRYTYK
ncbi:ATP synthase F1 gamma subunit [Babesia caballi]|uniref:F-ATPase gamma subunit n=1 Tax=Babesia caballi TaxID=5871 RepID=A0AAV4M1N6_BABCB|nr:ATP synthase F1 gamma subunit [Babesia caballi]